MGRKVAVIVPAGLGEAGSAFWSSVRAKYEMRDDELQILESACRGLDRIAEMELARAGRVTAFGSTGQLIVHPLVPEIRATEAQVASLLARLKLPDEEGAGEVVNQNRSAANSRWAAAHGKGA